MWKHLQKYLGKETAFAQKNSRSQHRPRIDQGVANHYGMIIFIQDGVETEHCSINELRFPASSVSDLEYDPYGYDEEKYERLDRLLLQDVTPLADFGKFMRGQEFYTIEVSAVFLEEESALRKDYASDFAWDCAKKKLLEVVIKSDDHISGKRFVLWEHHVMQVIDGIDQHPDEKKMGFPPPSEWVAWQVKYRLKLARGFYDRTCKFYTEVRETTEAQERHKIMIEKLEARDRDAESRT